MASINPYLNFQGNCAQAFAHYKSIFGGEYAMYMRFADAPPAPGQPPVNPDWVMHVSLPIGNGNFLMGSDAPEHTGPVNFGNNFSISVTVDSREEADRVFAGLSSGGVVTMPLADTFWGAYFGMVRDQFGVHWMVNYDTPRN